MMAARIAGLTLLLALTACFDAIEQPRCEGDCQDSDAADTTDSSDASGDAGTDAEEDPAVDEDPAEDAPLVCNDNGRCDPGEDHDGCSSDCRPCGDGVCEFGEAGCDADCGGERWPMRSAVFFNGLDRPVSFHLDGRFVVELPANSASPAFAPPDGYTGTIEVLEDGRRPALAQLEHEFGQLQFVAAFRSAGDTVSIRADSLPPPDVDTPGMVRFVQLDPRGDVQVDVDGHPLEGEGRAGSVSPWMGTCETAQLRIDGSNSFHEEVVRTGGAASFAFLHLGENAQTQLTVVTATQWDRPMVCGDGCCSGTEDRGGCAEDCTCVNDGLCEDTEHPLCPDCKQERPVDGPGFAVVNTLNRDVELWTVMDGSELTMLVQVGARSATDIFLTSPDPVSVVSYTFKEVGGAVITQSGPGRIATKSVVILADVGGSEVVIRSDPTTVDLLQLSTRQAGIGYANFAPALSGEAGVVFSGGGEQTRLTAYELTGKYGLWANVGETQLTWARDQDESRTFRVSLPIEAGWYYFGVVVDGPDDTSEMLLAPLGTFNDH